MKKILSFVLCMVMAFGLVGGIVPDVSPLDMSISAEAASKITMPYNYSKLSEDEQVAYKKIRNAVIECKKKVKVNISFTDDQLNKFYELLSMADPLTFNLADIGGYTYDTYSELELEYYYTKEAYDKMMTKVNKKANAILAKVTEDMSTYNQLKLFHDELIKMNTYDLSVEHCADIYGAFVTNEIKCVGYTVGFSYLCNLSGIKNTQAYSGDFLNGGEGHIWNKVYYNKKWYNIDCTFDDPISSMTDNLSYNCFMVSDKTMKRIHNEAEIVFGFKTPSATDDSKSYYAVSKLVANDSSETIALLKKTVVSAAKKKKTSATIKFADTTVYKESKKMLNQDKLIEVLRSANKSLGTENKFLNDYYYYYFDPDSLTLTVSLFYPNTKLSKYFVDASELDKDELDYLNQNGIK